MRTVKQLLEVSKSHRLFTIEPTATVIEVVKLLARENVGAVVVLEDDKLAGIVSERDVTRKIFLQGANPNVDRVDQIMTRNVITVSSEMSTRECMVLMTAKNIRQLPVVEAGRVVGLISIRDIVNDIIADQDFTISQMASYINS